MSNAQASVPDCKQSLPACGKICAEQIPIAAILTMSVNMVARPQTNHLRAACEDQELSIVHYGAFASYKSVRSSRLIVLLYRS